MSNTINVNYMTRAYNQYQQKNAAKDQEKEDTRFADSVREKSEASGSIVGNSKIGSVSAKDMTMVEYKQYIYNKISYFTLHYNNCTIFHLFYTIATCFLVAHI